MSDAIDGVTQLRANILDIERLQRIRDMATPPCFTLSRDAASILAGAYLDLLERCAFAERGWIPVTKELPTHNYSVLGRVVGGELHHGDDYTEVVSYIREAGGWKQGGIYNADTGETGDIDVAVSKWMRLPE